MKPIISEFAMARVVPLMLLFFTAVEVGAITWSFDTPGDAQGWVSREDMSSGAPYRSRLRSEVVDGVWRVYPRPYEAERNPAIELVSPVLRHDSVLFDRVRLRFRLVHTRPVQGFFTLHWTNAANQGPYEDQLTYSDPDSSASGIDVLVFGRGHTLTYTTGWQEVAIGDLQPGVFAQGADLYKLVWEGELLDIRLKLNPFAASAGSPFIAGPEDVPEAIEVDWIQVTGVEEQMQGELPPPSDAGSLSLGHFFAAPVFSAVRKGVQSPAWVPMAALGDLDGDGDPDLVTMWEGQKSGAVGWLVAVNEGQGRFREGQVVIARWPFSVAGADLDADGLMDVVDKVGTDDLNLRHSDLHEGLVLARIFPTTRYVGLGDADGDGDVDLWTGSSTFDQVQLWRNDGKGQFPDPLAVGTDLIASGYGCGMLVSHLNRGMTVGLLWAPPSGNRGLGYEVTYLGESGEWVQAHLATSIDPLLIRYAGDLDQDGDVDLVVSSRREGMTLTGPGVDLLVNQGDGLMLSQPWQGEGITLWNDVLFIDVDGDGVLDPVFVDPDLRGPAVVVSLGQREGTPLLEGRYPLSGNGGRVLAADVDVDGDVDLVVLEKAGLDGNGGVHVLLNRLSEQRTAVLETEGQVPAAFHLGANYPNPFNPQTWIPLEIPADTESARLQVYDLLGQPVRTLVSGRLAPGYHAVSWDGRDERGAAVSSGVYLYRLETGAWRATGRMVKTQ